MADTEQAQFKVLLWVESSMWIAQCLNYDIAEQGSTIDSALENLAIAIVGHMTSVDGHSFSNVPAAPSKYWMMWENAKTIEDYQASDFASFSPAVANVVAIAP